MIKVLNHFKTLPQDAISFGDQYTDIIASNNINIESVACLWGNSNNSDLLKSNPTFIIKKSIDLSI